MSESEDDTLRLAAETLQALRKSKGFRSANAAADHYGWPASRYRSHESSARPILEKDAERYAVGFGVPVRHLTDPTRERLIKLTKDVQRQEDLSRRGVAERLMCARILAGFDSARGAAESWHWASATYLKHENGENAVGQTAIEMYAAAFGVRGEWLRDGITPSGLGRKIDVRIWEVLKDPNLHRHLRRALPPVDPARIARLKDSLKIGRPSALVGIKEYRWKDLEHSRGQLSSVKATNVWNVPPSFVPEGKEVFVLSVESQSDHMGGYWLFVLPGGPTDRQGQMYLVAKDWGLSISEGPLEDIDDKKVLGAVIGKLRSAFEML